MKQIRLYDVSTRIPVQECPVCGAGIDETTGARQPKPGDVTLCCYCLAYLIFEPGMTMRRATMMEELEYSRHPLIPIVQESIRQTWQKHPHLKHHRSV